MKRAKAKKKHGTKARAPAAVTQASRASVARDASGRVHLVLTKDPKDGRTALGLRAPLFAEAWQNEIAASAATTVYQSLERGPTKERVVATTRSLMDATSRIAEGLLSRAANGTVECKAGCDHCCYQSVGVTPAEALTIFAHVQQRHDEAELRELGRRIAEARERTRSLTPDQRFSPEHPCPFLAGARCTIYEVRPLSCRGMNSLDAQECADNLREPEARARFLETGVGGRSFLEPIRAFHAVSAGLQLSLAELFGLDMLPLDLTAAIDELFRDASGIAREWLAGKTPLAEARGGDSTANAQSRELSGALDEAPRRD